MLQIPNNCSKYIPPLILFSCLQIFKIINFKISSSNIIVVQISSKGVVITVPQVEYLCLTGVYWVKAGVPGVNFNEFNIFWIYLLFWSCLIFLSFGVPESVLLTRLVYSCFISYIHYFTLLADDELEKGVWGMFGLPHNPFYWCFLFLSYFDETR